MASKPYQYTPLDESKRQIRLLTLFSGTATSPIRGSLVISEFTLDHIPQFEALSYVWGSTENPSSIQLGDTEEESISITENLGLALPHLRHQNELRVLWIDAICVNQQDLDERSSQVKRMADIYENARRVVVWLGPASKDSSMAISCFKMIASRIIMDWDNLSISPTPGPESNRFWEGQGSHTQFSQAQLEAIWNFLNRPWFKRLWIWQEIKLASPAALVTVGSETILWSFIRTAVGFLRLILQNNPVFEKCLTVAMYLCKPTKTRFIQLLYATNSTLCSDPKDRVFALLSLLDPVLEHIVGMEPDYTNSVSEVYQNFFKIYTTNTRKLLLLSNAEISRCLKGAPSWVPNWSLPQSSDPVTRTFAAMGTDAIAVFGESDNTLRVSGLTVGTITCISAFNMSSSTSDTFILDLRRVVSDMGLLPELTLDAEKFRSFCKILMLGIYAERFHPAHTSYLNLQQMEKTFRKIFDSSDGESIVFAPDVLHALWKISQNCFDHSFFMTREGNMGLGPSEAKEGDIVTGLLGCNSVMILRPAKNNQYQVVGKSFSDGFMDGEALLGPFPGKFEFVLWMQQGSLYEAFIDRETGVATCKDPRLGELPPGWERIAHKQEEFWNFFVNKETGEQLWETDPRSTPELLRKRGVNLRDFDLI